MDIQTLIFVVPIWVENKFSWFFSWMRWGGLKTERKKGRTERKRKQKKRQEVDRNYKWKKSDRRMTKEWMRKRSYITYRLTTCVVNGSQIMNGVKEEKKRWSSPDVSHTLHMWLWLTFHLPPSLPPSVLTSLSGCQRCFSAWRQSFTKVCVSSSHLLHVYPFTSW